MEYTIHFKKNPSPDDIQILNDGIIKEHKIKKEMEPLDYFARKSHCRFITVNTFCWEALDFYKKLGFYVEFGRHGFDKDSVFYFLRKDLL